MSFTRDLKKMCRNYPLYTILLVVVLSYVMCTQGVFKKFTSLLGFNRSGFDVQGKLSSGPDMVAPVAAEEGTQSGQKAVTGMRTPATCYPQETLKPEDLLPEDESKAIKEFNS